MSARKTLLVQDFSAKLYAVDVDSDKEVDVSDLRRRVEDIAGPFPEDDTCPGWRLIAGLRDLHDDDVLSKEEVATLPTLQLVLRLDGGKGGFGSMLKMLGKNIGNKTSNTEAMRDISGRRLRHINSEKKLTEWYAMEEERKEEAELEKKKRKLELMELKQEYLALEKDAAIKDTREATADIGDAVKQGLKARKKKEKAKLAAKKGEDEAGPSQADGAAAPASSAPATSTEAAEPSPKRRKVEEAPAAESPAAPAPAAEEAPKEWERIDLQKAKSKEDLEAFGLEHLKAELMARDMKCGGTLQQRAERLWEVRGPPELLGNNVPEQLRAGAKKNKKKK